MNRFRCLLLPLLFLFTGLSGQSGGVIDWEYEIDLLARELAIRHPDLFFRTDSAWFFREMKQAAAVVNGKNIFQVSVRLQQIIASLGDAQTQVNYHFLVDRSLILPVEFYWFEDGIYILKTDRLYEGLLGKRVTAVHHTPLGVVIDSLATLLVNDNPSVLKYNAPRMLSWYQLLEYFGFTGENELSLTVENSDGEEETIMVTLPYELGEMVEAHPRTVPQGWLDQMSFFRDQYFEGEHLYYIQYNRCWSREAEEDYGSGASALFMPSFKEFEKEVISTVKKQEIDKLVFDMRFNRGGNAAQGSLLIGKICRLLRNRTTSVFVLIGRATYGAAIINTIDFMQQEKVILVGEETSGKPNHFGEVERFVLPESGLIISYPTVRYSLMEGDLPSIEPDLPAPMDFAQYMNGIDPAFEAVRSYERP